MSFLQDLYPCSSKSARQGWFMQSRVQEREFPLPILMCMLLCIAEPPLWPVLLKFPRHAERQGSAHLDLVSHLMDMETGLPPARQTPERAKGRSPWFEDRKKWKLPSPAEALLRQCRCSGWDVVCIPNTLFPWYLVSSQYIFLERCFSRLASMLNLCAVYFTCRTVVKITEEKLQHLSSVRKSTTMKSWDGWKPVPLSPSTNTTWLLEISGMVLLYSRRPETSSLLMEWLVFGHCKTSLSTQNFTFTLVPRTSGTSRGLLWPGHRNVVYGSSGHRVSLKTG